MRRGTVATLLGTMLAGACGGGVSEEPNAETQQPQESAVAVRLADFVVEAEPIPCPRDGSRST